MRPPSLPSAPGRPRARLLDRGRAFAALAGLFLLILLFAAMVAVLRHPVTDDEGAPAPPRPASAILDRCRRMGPPAGDDAACRNAWADARNAFFQIEEPQP